MDARIKSGHDEKGEIQDQMDSAKKIVQGLEEALAHAQGKDVLCLVVHMPSALDVDRRTLDGDQPGNPSILGMSSRRSSH